MMHECGWIVQESIHMHSTHVYPIQVHSDFIDSIINWHLVVAQWTFISLYGRDNNYLNGVPCDAQWSRHAGNMHIPLRENSLNMMQEKR